MPSPVGSAKENVGEEKGDVGERKPIGSNKSCDESVQKVEISAYILRRKRKKQGWHAHRFNFLRILFVHYFVSSQSTFSKIRQIERAIRPKPK